MMTKTGLIEDLVGYSIEKMDDYSRVVKLPPEGSPEETALIVTLEKFFENLIDNLNRS